MLVIAGCRRAFCTQLEPCAISGRGVARPDPCGGRGGMHRALVLAAPREVWWVLPFSHVGLSGQHSPPTATQLFELHGGVLC